MTKSFTTREKIILTVLVLFLIGVCYYQFFDKPLRDRLAKAEAENTAIQTELTAVNMKIATLQQMKDEIDDITANGKNSYMASYNNSKAELQLLNDILSKANQYSITFANVSRNGDQIRRDFSLNFTAPDYDTMQRIINNITGAEYRCLLGNLSCNLGRIVYEDRTVYGELSVNVTATFFETMVGGEEDSGLPA
jgi:Tfp pilus assembly protein PilN